MQKEMLIAIHSSHLGIEKCKQLERDTLFWPRMNFQLEDQDSRCAANNEGTTQKNRSYHTRSHSDHGKRLTQNF
jgi:hypothetical protein